MTTGAKYFCQMPTAGGLLNYGPWDTLPRAQKELEKIIKHWKRTPTKTPPGLPTVMIVKVIEEQYLGARE